MMMRMGLKQISHIIKRMFLFDDSFLVCMVHS